MAKSKEVNKWEKPFRFERGDVYMADLGSEYKAVGSEQAGIRPVVVTQCNRQNNNSTTILVAAGTSQIKRMDLPYHVLVPKHKGLPRQTMFCAEQRFALSVERFLNYRCTLGRKTMKDITRACHKAEEDDKKRRSY